MSFWKNLKPTRRRNFKVQLAKGKVWYWVKTVTKPSVEVETNEYQLINHKLKYPGLVAWNDVTITMIDVGSKAKELLDALKSSGYSYPDGSQKGIAKKYAGDAAKYIIIEQYGTDLKKPVEKWVLQNSFIKSINFGQLDYSDDDFVELELVISYDWAELGDSDASVTSPPSETSSDVVVGDEPPELPSGDSPNDKSQ